MPKLDHTKRAARTQLRNDRILPALHEAASIMDHRVVFSSLGRNNAMHVNVLPNTNNGNGFTAKIALDGTIDFGKGTILTKTHKRFANLFAEALEKTDPRPVSRAEKPARRLRHSLYNLSR